MTAPLFDVTSAVRTTTQTPEAAPMPGWLQRRLHAAGILDEDTGATRRAKARTCPACRQPVLVGFDGDRAALVATTDPWPLSRRGEALALLDGRRTYLLAHAGHYELEHRTAARIRGHPAATRFDVLAEHRHHAPTPAAWRTSSVLRDPAALTIPADQPPPF